MTKVGLKDIGLLTGTIMDVVLTVIVFRILWNAFHLTTFAKLIVVVLLTAASQSIIALISFMVVALLVVGLVARYTTIT